jgi:hypothetical protein
LFDATVILLQPVIEILIRSMLYMAPYRLADGSGIRTMPIGRDVVGSMANYSNCLLEKLLGRIHISLFTQL